MTLHPHNNSYKDPYLRQIPIKPCHPKTILTMTEFVQEPQNSQRKVTPF